MSEKENFIRFCGLLLGNAWEPVWEQLSPEQQNRYCQLAQESGWSLLFVQTLKKRLPEPFYQNFRNRYRRESLTRLIESRDLANFYQFLEAEKISYIPVKGADLAFRIYPEPALRPHGDWDILFREEDCPRVLRLLQQNNWRTFSGYGLQATEHYHYERMHNGHHSLEVHWTLPHFGSAAPGEIWDRTEKINEFRRVLAPEMNLLLLAAHAGSEEYTHSAQWKILLDAGMILKHDDVDWQKIHQLADRWGILRPDLLLHVWSGFFPEGCLPPENPQDKRQQLIREIFETRRITQQYSGYEKQLSGPETFNIRWLKKRLRFYNAASICLKYHLPAHQNGKIILYGLRDFFEKCFFCLTRFRSADSGLHAYYQKVADLEKQLKQEKTGPVPGPFFSWKNFFRLTKRKSHAKFTSSLKTDGRKQIPPVSRKENEK